MPDHRGDVQAVIRAIQMNAFSHAPVIKNDVKGPQHGNYELMKLTMGMASAFGTARHVVEIVHTFNSKGHVVAPFDEGKAAMSVRNLGQVKQLARINREGGLHSARKYT